MQPTARQHDADLREQMRSKNMQKYDFDTAARHFSQKKQSTVPQRALAANFYEHLRTLKPL